MLQRGPRGRPRRLDAETRSGPIGADAAIIARAGLFDADFYAAANPEVPGDAEELLVHFADEGWRELRSPCADFDVWWYWETYLDPAAATVNPVVHYIETGRARGNATRPTRTPWLPATRLDPTRPTRRICLFAAYDVDDVLDDYVVHYLTELARFCDVYYLADGALPDRELAKLDGIARGAWSVRHGAYDFGSLSLLARDLVGWDVIDGYDELLFANDSCYLMRPLDDVFARMDSTSCDWWGLQLSCLDHRDRVVPIAPKPLTDVKRDLTLRAQLSQREHISSYFLAFRRPVISSAAFRTAMDAVAKQDTKSLVVLKYEIGLSSLLIREGHEFATFIPDLHAFHPLYNEHYFALVEQGFPLLKRNLLSENSLDVPGLANWKQRITALVPDAPVASMEENLRRVAADDHLDRSFAVTEDEYGLAVPPRIMTHDELAAADTTTPTFAHWWVFPVASGSHDLSDDARAILEEVKDDPTLKKVVLTRSLRMEIEGANVECLPLLSVRGQHRLLRCGHAFLTDDQTAELAFLGRLDQRRLVRVGGGTAAADAAGPPGDDLVLRASSLLPESLRREEAELRDLLAGRHLVMVLPGGAPGTDAAGLTDDETAGLAEWCAANDAVLGLRGSGATAGLRTGSQDLPLIDLGPRRIAQESTLLRCTTVLVSDRPAARRTFARLGSGRPVVWPVDALSSATLGAVPRSEDLSRSGLETGAHDNAWRLVRQLRLAALHVSDGAR